MYVHLKNILVFIIEKKSLDLTRLYIPLSLPLSLPLPLATSIFLKLKTLQWGSERTLSELTLSHLLDSKLPCKLTSVSSTNLPGISLLISLPHLPPLHLSRSLLSFIPFIYITSIYLLYTDLINPIMLLCCVSPLFPFILHHCSLGFYLIVDTHVFETSNLAFYVCFM